MSICLSKRPMEKIKCICVMRELFQALSSLESSLQELYGLSLNEAMVLCCIGQETVTAGTIVERTGLTPSHASKVIRQAEKKGLLLRELSAEDRRQMRFTLTDKARRCLELMKERGVEIPELLRPLFEGAEM